MNNNITAGTVARLICLVLAAINQIFLLKTGHSLLPIESSELESWITTGLTFAASAWAYWKNNSWTKEAIEADDTLHLMKKNKRT